MSRSRAREQGEKINQTLHSERAGIIKTFHTGETKGRGAWSASSARVFVRVLSDN